MWHWLCLIIQENEEVHLDDSEAIKHKVVVAGGQQASVYFIDLNENKILHK